MAGSDLFHYSGDNGDYGDNGDFLGMPVLKLQEKKVKKLQKVYPRVSNYCTFLKGKIHVSVS